MTKKEEEIDKIYKKLSKRKDNVNKSKEQLVIEANQEYKINEMIIEFDVDSMFNYLHEKKYAKKLISKYLIDYTIETVSDKNTLCQLIFLEVTQQRLQTVINDFYKDSKTVSKEALDSIHKNTDKIISLKNTLGITRSRQETKVKDAYSYLQMLKRKRKRWLSDNQASRYLTCPHCSESIMLKIKTDAWTAQKHPFFKDRILGNAHLIQMYQDNKLSRDDLAKVFDVSPSYIDWLVERAWSLSSVIDKPTNKKEPKQTKDEPTSENS